MDKLIAPKAIKNGIFRCLTAGTKPEFPEQGTPQGSVVSPLLANIALNGIEDIHKSVRYADDMVFILKPKDDAKKILQKVEKFLADRGMEISQEKTKLTIATDGFDFLGWNFKVQKKNGKFRCTPSEDNYLTFRKKVKTIVNDSRINAETKAQKLSAIVRGWRNYHKYCKMDGSRFSLWFLNDRTFKVFLKEKRMSKYKAEELIKKAFPPVSYSENRHVNVKEDKSPFDGDLIYWSKRESKLYDGSTAQLLKKQHYTCEECDMKFMPGEKIHLHHKDGNHNNWKHNNLAAMHRSCHQYTHIGKAKA